MTIEKMQGYETVQERCAKLFGKLSRRDHTTLWLAYRDQLTNIGLVADMKLGHLLEYSLIGVSHNTDNTFDVVANESYRSLYSEYRQQSCRDFLMPDGKITDDCGLFSALILAGGELPYDIFKIDADLITDFFSADNIEINHNRKMLELTGYGYSIGLRNIMRVWRPAKIIEQINSPRAVTAEPIAGKTGTIIVDETTTATWSGKYNTFDFLADYNQNFHLLVDWLRSLRNITAAQRDLLREVYEAPEEFQRGGDYLSAKTLDNLAYDGFLQIDEDSNDEGDAVEIFMVEDIAFAALEIIRQATPEHVTALIGIAEPPTEPGPRRVHGAAEKTAAAFDMSFEEMQPIVDEPKAEPVDISSITEKFLR